MKTTLALLAVLLLSSQALAQAAAAAAATFDDKPLCSIGAATCNESKSLTCRLGYYLSADKCEACSSGCAKCTGNKYSECTECYVGYVNGYDSCI